MGGGVVIALETPVAWVEQEGFGVCGLLEWLAVASELIDKINGETVLAKQTTELDGIVSRENNENDIQHNTTSLLKNLHCKSKPSSRYSYIIAHMFKKVNTKMIF